MEDPNTVKSPAEEAPKASQIEPKNDETIEAQNNAGEEILKKETENNTEKNLEADKAQNSTDEIPQVEDIEIVVDVTTISKEDILNTLANILERDGKDIVREEISRLRQHFSNLRRDEIAAEKEKFLNDGGVEDDFVPAIDIAEQKLQNIIAEIKQKKNLWLEQRDKELKENLEKKEAILAEISALALDTDNVNRSYSHFKELSQQFRDTGDVPPENSTSIWKKFQDAEQKFYDQLKINQELRDYDFKKNLEVKKTIIEKAQKLAQNVSETVQDGEKIVESTIIESFRALQDLHELWKVTGPVAKDLRDEIWESFKEATVTVNKAYQNYFEQRKANEKANEEAKKKLIDEVTNIDFSKINTIKEWDENTKKVIQAQNDWKNLGFASRKVNNALFVSFRKACDEFFNKKSEFFSDLKKRQAENIELKTALTLRAEELSDSTDWNVTATELTKLQADWKKIGPTPKKQGDALWERFHSACDKFFSNRKKLMQDSRKAERENLAQKEAVLKELNELLNEENDIKDRLNQLQSKWKEIGFVPLKEKNRIADEYRDTINKIRKKFNMNDLKASFEKFKSNIEDLANDNNKLSREREKLFRFLENKRNDLSTYMNNMGFLKSKSKNGEGLIKEIEHKIQLIQADIADLEDKISLIDSKM